MSAWLLMSMHMPYYILDLTCFCLRGFTLQVPQAYIFAELISPFSHWTSLCGCPTDISDSICSKLIHHFQ